MPELSCVHSQLGKPVPVKRPVPFCHLQFGVIFQSPSRFRLHPHIKIRPWRTVGRKCVGVGVGGVGSRGIDGIKVTTTTSAHLFKFLPKHLGSVVCGIALATQQRHALYTDVGLRVEVGEGSVVPDPAVHGVRGPVVGFDPVDKDATGAAHGADQDVGPGFGEDGAAVASEMELGVVGEHGPVLGQAGIGDAGNGAGVVPAQLGEEAVLATQVALDLQGALLGVDLRDGVGQQQAPVVPVPVEDDVPRLHVRGERVVRRHAVVHEGEVGAVPVRVDVEGGRDGGLEGGGGRAPRREGLQVRHAPEHEHFDGDGFLEDLGRLFEAAWPSGR